MLGTVRRAEGTPASDALTSGDAGVRAPSRLLTGSTIQYPAAKVRLGSAPESPILTSPSPTTQNNRKPRVARILLSANSLPEQGNRRCYKFDFWRILARARALRAEVSRRPFHPANIPILPKFPAIFAQYAHHPEPKSPVQSLGGRVRQHINRNEPMNVFTLQNHK